MALSGVSAVALAYLSEEVSISIIGLIISLYLSGNTIGGMLGRVITTLISGWGGWRMAAVVIGVLSLGVGLVFYRYIPESLHFKPQKVLIPKKFKGMKLLLKNPLFLGMFMVAALIMGIFVSIYNYLSFRLEAPPFSLPHYIIAMIFLMYIIGVAGSIISGKRSDSMNPSRLLKGLLILMATGLFLLKIEKLWVIIFGLGLFTFAFFGAHTMASRIISQYSTQNKSEVTCLYWLFYYMGSSLAGYFTGMILAEYQWDMFINFVLGMAALSWLITLWVTRKQDL
jgi:YNFM family putative membrane transporter